TMDGLRRLVEDEPFFRAGNWAEARFGALSVPELLPDFQAVLAERPLKPHLVSCVLDALESGPPRRDIVADLELFLSDGTAPLDIRSQAVGALRHVTQGDPSVARELFRRTISDDVGDPRAHLAGRLLLELYPRCLRLEDLMLFLDRFMASDSQPGDRLHL